MLHGMPLPLPMADSYVAVVSFNWLERQKLHQLRVPASQDQKAWGLGCACLATTNHKGSFAFLASLHYIFT